MEGRLASEGRICMKATRITMSTLTIVLLCCVLSPAQTQSAKPLPDSPLPQATRESLEKAAAAGSAEAMYMLGELYYEGEGLPQDSQKAAEWYEKAAAGGSVAAMNDLGVMYQEGHGLAQDYQRARDWYERAAAAGS